MRRRGGRAATGLMAGLVAALLLGGVAVTGASAAGAGRPADVEGAAASDAPSAAPSAVVGADDPPLSIAITEIDPVVGVGDDVHLRVQVHNDSAASVAEPRLLVHLDRAPFISRSSLDQWRDAGTDGAIGEAVLLQDVGAPLAPGQTVTVDLTVPAAEVGLPRRLTSWGARGLAVQVVDVADPVRVRLGLARTFLLWFPEQEVTATRLSVAVPVTGVGVDPFGGAWVSQLEELTGTGGRLAALVEATGDHPGVTWVVDPWLTDPSNGAGPAAQAWAGNVANHGIDRDVQLLGYLDPDLAALAHAGAGELLTAAITRAEATDTVLPDSAQVTVGWPADDLPDLTTAALAERSGQDAVLVGPGELLPPGVLTYTPSGRTTVAAGGADVTVLVPDERLSAAFRTGVVGPLGADGTETAGAAGAAARVVTPATAGQDLLAELAVITRERPSDSRHLLVTVPRTWMADVAVVDGQLDALEAAPWVRLEPMSALIGLADPEIDRGTLPARTDEPDEVGVTELGTVRDAVERRTHLATIVAAPQTLLGDLTLEQLAPASVAWRADPAGRAASVQASFDATQAISGAVTAQPSSGSVLLPANSGGLPVRVTNTFDQAVTVEVALRPSDPRLIADDTRVITLEPGAEQMVQIPVHAVQSADVVVAVELRTPDGTLLDDSTEFEVRVRAEWESIGTAVLAGILLIGLVIGLIRTVRRGRTARRARPDATLGPDAMSPEEAEEQAEDEGAEAEERAHTPAVDDADTPPSAPHLVQGKDDAAPPQETRPT